MLPSARVLSHGELQLCWGRVRDSPRCIGQQLFVSCTGRVVACFSLSLAEGPQDQGPVAVLQFSLPFVCSDGESETQSLLTYWWQTQVGLHCLLGAFLCWL